MKNQDSSQNEIKLEQHFTLLSSMYKNIPLGISIFNKDGILLSMNNKNREIFGLPDDYSVEGVCIFDEANTPNEIKDKIRAGIDTEYEVSYDFEAIAAAMDLNLTHRKIKYFNVKTATFRNNSGEVDGYLQICEDITKKKEAEELQIYTNAKLSAMFNSNSSGLEIFNKDGFLVDCNKEDLNIFGIENKQDYINSKLSIFNSQNIPKDKIEDIIKGKAVHFNSIYDFDKVNNIYTTTKSGKIYISVKTEPILSQEKEIIGYLIETTDISIIENQNIKIQEYTKNIELALKAGRVSTWEYNIETEIIHFPQEPNDNKKEISLSERLKAYHPEDKDIILSLLNDFIKGKTDSTETITRIYDEDYGDYRHYEIITDSRKNYDGKIKTIVGTKHDITQKRIKEIEMNNIRTSLDMIMDATKLLAWDYDVITQKHRILY